MYKKMSAARKSELDIATVKIDQSKKAIFLSGSWGWSSLDESIMAQFSILQVGEWLVDGSNISNIDTTGFYFVHKLIHLMTAAKSTISKVVLLPEDQVLYDLTKSCELRSDNALNEDQSSSFLSKVGEGAAEVWHTCLQLTAFFGQLCTTVATLFKRDYPLYVKGIIETISTAV